MKTNLFKSLLVAAMAVGAMGGGGTLHLQTMKKLLSMRILIMQLYLLRLNQEFL